MQTTASQPFHIMTKPIGPLCNLDCRYCFYLEKENLYPDKKSWQMNDAVLENYIKNYIAAQPIPEVTFAWQGGEPTLLGVDFFRKVVELEKKYANGKKIQNALQTNGTLLNAEWCEFFRENDFLIGISIDGPKEMHDRYRVDKGGNPTFRKVLSGLNLLKEHQVEFNTLTVVNRENAKNPLELYRFLRKHGSGHMQFIPLVEREGSADGLLSLAEPPTPDNAESAVTSWSVLPRDWGNFLCTIFDEWIKRDVGNVFIQLFETQLGIRMGMPSSLCVFGETCGNAMAMEHNGDVYSCDHYVYPQYLLGNIADSNIIELVESPKQRKFGQDKKDTLPSYCRRCEVRFACNGECPKHRFLKTPDGENGLNYLCEGYRKFFNYCDAPMRAIGQLLREGRPATDIMEMAKK
jgi:uncharacterized protein